MPSFISNSIVILLLALFVSPAMADVTSQFDAGTEGWLVVSYPFRSHVADPGTTGAPFDAGFGNPSGSLRVGDVYGETGLAAPSAYLGDKSAYYGGSLSYDILIRFSDVIGYPAAVLNGGTISLYYETFPPPLDAWYTFEIPLTEAGWRVSGGTTFATETQFRSVLANLQGLYIYTEWNTGDDDTSVDNVSLSAPAQTPALLPAGIAVLVALLLLAASRRLAAPNGTS